MTRHKIAALLAAVALSGCALMPKTPQQGVYELGATYATALKVAVAYEQLPACGGSTVVCSDPGVLAKIRAADASAYAAYTAAEQAAQAGGADTSTLLTSATVAVQAFAALANSLKVH
jgi:hypothetical protein